METSGKKPQNRPKAVAKRKPQPKSPEDDTNAEPLPRSSLYDRANGFSLGCFLSLIRYGFARPAYRFHRARIAEFAEEAGLPIALPATQRQYNGIADQVLTESVLWTNIDSPELADFIRLGAHSVIDASLRLSGEPIIDELRTQAIGILNRHGFDGATLYDRFLAYVRKMDEEKERGGVEVRIDPVLTPAMHLLTRTLEPLATDASMCFVAMPFKQPYSDYFRTFYEPLAKELECRAFRMWGGLSGEAYVELMLTMMRRCRIVIADLSNLNGNVLYEFGVARGLGKQVVPLVQRAFASKLPSNIASDQLLQLYSPREKDWPAVALQRCALQASLIKHGEVLEERELDGARWMNEGRLPHLPEDESASPTDRKKR